MSPSRLAGARSRVADYLDLTKPRLSSLVVGTAAAGMVLAPSGPPAAGTAALALLAVAAVVGGANALNCYLERDADACMERTRARPLPAGRMAPRSALLAGAILCTAGIAGLWAVRPLAGLLAVLAVASYVFVYTPLKRVTPLCTLVGAVPGAIPPVIGWVVASGRLDPGAWVLFAWLFLWQPPHFLALATLYHDDYRAAGMQVLPVRYPGGAIVKRQLLLYAAALVPVPLLLVPLSRAGTLTLIAAPLLGLGFLAVALRALAMNPAPAAGWARPTFLASIAYLGLSLVVLVIDAGAVR
jgi:protoheme IX farnesyltransferase